MKLRERLKNLFGRIDMAEATTQPKNYTDEMVSSMVDQYQAEPSRVTVEALAKTFGKSTRSIIAKLSREGVYKAQPRTTKSGAPVVRKVEIVQSIQADLNISELETLQKASKADLVLLLDAIRQVKAV